MIISLPLLTVSLPLATLCVFVCVFLRVLMAGHWPLPLLGKLCLCPWGLQICATPEPQLQLRAQAGAKSFLPPPLLHLHRSQPPISSSFFFFLSSFSEVAFVSAWNHSLQISSYLFFFFFLNYISLIISKTFSPLCPNKHLIDRSSSWSSLDFLSASSEFLKRTPSTSSFTHFHVAVLMSVFTSPPPHVRQATTAAIACLPFWTVWPC